MAEDSEVSDVDPDDLAEMIKGIDDLDDDLFGKKKKTPVSHPPKTSVLKTDTETSQGIGRNVKFSTEPDSDTIDKNKDASEFDSPIKNPPAKEASKKKAEINFDDDDILAGLDSAAQPSKKKPSASFMDDIFGKPAEKEKKSSFLDDLLSGKPKEKPKEISVKSEFTLDPKYKQAASSKSELGMDFVDTNPVRRRRGNPTVGESTLPKTDQIAPPATNVPQENSTPFPWMAAKTTSKTEQKQSNQNENTKVNESMQKSTSVQNQNQYVQPNPLGPTIHFTPTLPHPPTPISASSQIVPIQENDIIDKNQQLVFEQDMEQYKRMMADRKAEHAAAIEQQRRQMAMQMQELQQKQNQATQSQTEQGQRMLQCLQAEMAAETAMRQQLLSNQMQMVTQMQLEVPNSHFDANQDFETFKKGGKEGKEKLINMMKDKIEEVEVMFKIKEERMQEHYESFIKDMEVKLEAEKERYKDLVERFDEEKKTIIKSHKSEIINLTEESKLVQESLKSEYSAVIKHMKDLRKVELDSVHEITESASKMTEITSTVDSNTKNMAEIQVQVQKQISEEAKRKELYLEQKEKYVSNLQESLVKRQEQSEADRHKLTEAVAKLESQVSLKQMKLEEDIKELASAKAVFELSKTAFESDRDSALAKLKGEKLSNTEELKTAMSDIKKQKNDLEHKEKLLQIERARYHIHRRLNEGEITNDSSFNRNEVEGVMKALEEEKRKLKEERVKLKEYKRKVIKSGNKIKTQKEELGDAIEKLCDVETGLNEKFREIDHLVTKISHVRNQNDDLDGYHQDVKEAMINGVREIQGEIVGLLQQEQKTKAEKFHLLEERKKLNNTRNSTVCIKCNRSAKKFTSVQDLNVCGEENNLQRFGIGWSQGWISELGAMANLRPRSSGDGASHEVLDSNVTLLRKEADNDNQFLKNEMEYLRSIQKINMSTLSKYQ